MRLGEFILHDMDGILQEWDEFAATHIPAAAKMTPEAVRDHAKQILTVVAKDLSTPQTKQAQADKSKGLAPEKVGDPETAAETHAVLRAGSGFDINELAAEYRALRASVLRRWMEACRSEDLSLEDVVRFNEGIDQAISESIEYFTAQVDRTRNLVLAMLSHDMRNPLAAIALTASYLANLNAGGNVAKAASLLTGASKELMVLLDDMVDLKRIILGLGISIALADVDLATVFADELELLRGAHPGRQLELEVVGDARGRWDGPRLRRVLRNLVSNAIKYGAPDAPVRTVIVGDATDVRFGVTNSGPTIERSALEQIFDPFTRCFAAGLGNVNDASLGLGLFIVREVARAHGGEVAVHSAEGVTVFDVLLPRGHGALGYVVLFHDRESGPHFDWMFEGEEGLRTWATAERLMLDQADAATATELPLHRAAYLDYEGPVSGNRGSVRRVERGTFRVLQDATDLYELEVAGDRAGRLIFRRDHLADRSLWRIEFRPQINGEGTLAEAS